MNYITNPRINHHALSEEEHLDKSDIFQAMQYAENLHSAWLSQYEIATQLGDVDTSLMDSMRDQLGNYFYGFIDIMIDMYSEVASEELGLDFEAEMSSIIDADIKKTGSSIWESKSVGEYVVARMHECGHIESKNEELKVELMDIICDMSKEFYDAMSTIFYNKNTKEFLEHAAKAQDASAKKKSSAIISNSTRIIH